MDPNYAAGTLHEFGDRLGLESVAAGVVERQIEGGLFRVRSVLRGTDAYVPLTQIDPAPTTGDSHAKAERNQPSARVEWRGT